MPFAAEDATGQRGQSSRQSGIIVQEFLILQVHAFDRRGRAFVSVREIPERLIIIFGPEQFLPLNAESTRDAQRLVTDAAIQAEQFIQFIRRQEVPVSDRAANRLLIRMILDDALLDVWI